MSEEEKKHQPVEGDDTEPERPARPERKTNAELADEELDRISGGAYYTHLTIHDSKDAKFNGDGQHDGNNGQGSG